MALYSKDIRKPKNIAFAHDTNVYGGMEVYLLRLLKRLDHAKYHPFVLVSSYRDKWRSSPEKFLTEIAELDIPLLRSVNPGNAPLISTVEDIWRVAIILKNSQIDLIHIHTRHPTAARKTTLAAKLAGVKAIIRTEHLPPSINFNQFTKYIVKPFDRMTDCIVTDSDQNRDEHISLIGRNPQKVYRSYCGVELDDFNPDHDIKAARVRLGLDPDLFTIGAVGRLHEQKGLACFVDAAAHITKSRGNVHFLLVGDGPLRNVIENRIAELGLEDNFSLVGFQADYIPYMEAMDIGVMPSLWEGFSISMLEFMALGKPMVFSDHPSFQEAATHRKHALIVPRKDGKALGDAVLELMGDPALAKRLGAAARLRIEQEFTNQRLVDDMMNLYDSCLF
jgi:glycosyltransferase involved in cell wall biosynthesis